MSYKQQKSEQVYSLEAKHSQGATVSHLFETALSIHASLLCIMESTCPGPDRCLSLKPSIATGHLTFNSLRVSQSQEEERWL